MWNLPEDYFAKKGALYDERYVFKKLLVFTRNQFYQAGFKSPYDFSTFNKFNMHVQATIHKNGEYSLYERMMYDLVSFIRYKLDLDDDTGGGNIERTDMK